MRSTVQRMSLWICSRRYLKPSSWGSTPGVVARAHSTLPQIALRVWPLLLISRNLSSEELLDSVKRKPYPHGLAHRSRAVPPVTCPGRFRQEVLRAYPKM
ncbi:hypothetical protein Salmi_Mp057 (mitochondrion) [Salvia miltiorrhiza]|uniref:Uncharacterized protein n=1 Tax=Salvia miltiorrhiza TaxID=226208 RepID=V9P4Y3_SALMI|nr:hypothetical protein Salmi_Mp057 [Salvia miltiorrhiza]AGU16586.1 hypothetical protein Salmi_Mp057 [Salvia miltiorrhiza]